MIVLLLVCCSPLNAASEQVLTTSWRDLNGDGARDRIRVIMVSGRRYYDTNVWCGGECEKFEGRFVIEVKLAGHKTIRTDLNLLFCPEEPESELWFVSSPWNLCFADFNHDGQIDFTIGQYGGCNSWDYKIFSIKPSGGVYELPVIGDEYGIPNGHDGESTAFSGYDEPAPDGFFSGYYSNVHGTGLTHRYAWDKKLNAFVCAAHQIGDQPWKPGREPEPEWLLKTPSL
ncbi:MAG: hypothetical protein HY301_21260 [Verrucomicrobia bacterium]|nr:hypothetical protein [Verrucomicrobiota bacterium]